jgi:hypothetical protein
LSGILPYGKERLADHIFRVARVANEPQRESMDKFVMAFGEGSERPLISLRDLPDQSFIRWRSAQRPLASRNQLISAGDAHVCLHPD